MRSNAPLGLYLALFVVAPVAYLLASSFFGPTGAFDLTHYARLFTQPVYVRVLWSTLFISLWVALICTVVAPLAT